MPGCALDTPDDAAIAVAQHFFATTKLDWVAVLDDIADLDEVSLQPSVPCSFSNLCNTVCPFLLLSCLCHQVRALVPVGTNGRLIFTSATDLGNPQDVAITRLEVFSTQESLQVNHHISKH